MPPLALGGISAILSMALVLSVVLYFASPRQQFTVAGAMGFAIVASAIALAFATLGLLALEQAGVMGIGAFTMVALANSGTSVPVALAASLAVGLIVGLGFGLLAGQVNIFAYAIVGFAFSFLFAVVGSGPLINSFTGGDLGKPLAAAEMFGVDLMYGPGTVLLSGGVLMLVLIAEAGALRSSIGSILLQVRANPNVAATLGINQAGARTVTVMFVAGISSLGGAVTAVVTNFVTPGKFGPELVVLLLAVALFGGVTYAVGPVIGALSLVAIPTLLGFRGVDKVLIVAIVFLVVVLISGRGFTDLVVRFFRYMWHSVFRRRASESDARDSHSADAPQKSARGTSRER
jgi:branched-chain amino acid transport system permease protein